MMDKIFIVMLVFYLAAFLYFVRKRMLVYIHGHQKNVLRVKKTFQEMTQKKSFLNVRKKQLQEKASEIFTLYDMTKKITEKFDENDAFLIFEEKLRENVDYSKCQFLLPDDENIQQIKTNKEMFLYSLKGRRGLIGYLAVEDIAEDQRETVVILAHRLALALRRIRLYQAIEKMAITDSLTNVYTRRHILERFKEELRRSTARGIKLSFLMIDVDYFKHFNDQYGHLTGDQILREITRVIRESVREIDICGRYGGEEFSVILPDTDRGGAKFVAERIRTTVAQAMIRAYDTMIRTTVSCGIATFPDDGKQVDELIDKADWALYRAKKSGRNTTCSFGVYGKKKKG